MLKIIEINGYDFTCNQSQANYREHKWANSIGKTLEKTYANCSEEKLEVWRKCNIICNAVGGEYLCITGHNCDMFTASFVTKDPENGNITRVFWITRWHRYYADIE